MLHRLNCLFRFKLSSHTAHTRRLLHEAGMDLKDIVQKLEAFASKSLKADWDNVGLLVEPSESKCIKKIGLTNDLTEEVMAECVDKKADLIVAYHPPIFRPLKKLTQSDWKERVIISCVRNNIALFSPHTTWDAVQNGINDWLIRPFGPGITEPLESSSDFTNGLSHQISVTYKPENFSGIKEVLLHCGAHTILSDTLSLVSCRQSDLSKVFKLLSDASLDVVSVIKLEKTPIPSTGMGRIMALNDPISLSDAVQRTKSHLGLPHVRIAIGIGQSMDSPIRSVAVCAGSGASILTGVKADLLVSGEMSHHEVLQIVHSGASVILCEHSNSERGFLREFAAHFGSTLGPDVSVFVCETDKDSLTTV